MNGTDHDDHDINEDQGETEMDYQSVVYGLFRVLAQFANRQIDFIDEVRHCLSLLCFHCYAYLNQCLSLWLCRTC